MSEFSFQKKILLLGEFGVGKTSLILSFTRGNPHHVGVVEDEFKIQETNVGRIKFEFPDTAGQERNTTTLFTSLLRGTHGIIYVFDLSNKKSFESIRNIWKPQMDRYVSGVPTLLLANKKDHNEEHMWEVTRKEVEELGLELNARCEFVSATNDIKGVEAAFQIILNQIIQTCNVNFVPPPANPVVVQPSPPQLQQQQQQSSCPC